MATYDFSGWATRANMKCSDGRIIMKDAFKHNDRAEVPLVWNHQHNSPDNILGKALLHNRPEGVYAYCTFNDTESGQTAKALVEHGDVKALSIHANQLTEHMGQVSHGNIREVSLVLAGANPGAYIESIISHSDDDGEEAIIYTGEDITLSHAEDDDEEPKAETVADVFNTLTEKQKTVVYALIGQALEDGGEFAEDDDEDEEDKSVKHSDDDESKGETVADVFDTLSEKQKTVVYALIGQALEDAGSSADDEDDKSVEHSDDNKEDKNMANQNEKTVAEVFDTLTEEQKTVVYALIGQALEDADNEDEVEHSDGGNYDMKRNVFETAEQTGTFLTHADQEEIIKLAKSSSVGSLKAAMEMYINEHKGSLSHAFDDATGTYPEMSALFPDYKDAHPGAPELLERDMGWVAQVMKKAHKSPVSRVRTRQADARAAELRAKGYNDRTQEKAISGNIKMLMRTTDPQTIYYRDELHRDDIVDITDFDIIAYQQNVMRHGLEEMVALAALVGDGREDGDADKIHESHVRSIWHDEDLYTIKATVDIAAAKATLQGTNTAAHFGDSYVRSEAFLAAALYAREKYKGKGALDLYIAPHQLNVMLLARDLNGRRIYDSADDLAKALNVANIYTVEQMDGLTRSTDDDKTMKLLGIFVNMANYTFGSTKGGEITNFDQFDLDFNKQKFLMECRLSGALTEIQSAIVIEEDVTAEG